ncbi:hypothetical protein BD779DRAFT_1672364 [Infundibulicybe gibba]|nr:hypothetical protein BD779DRAFT_1672364 [Infundibulicybe gibba]
MQLTLSEPTPLNATYSNEMGQAIYKVDTPDTFFDAPTPRSVASSRSELAKIRMGGEEIKTKHFFRKVGWGWAGRDRLFTAPDGKEYKWKMGMESLSVCPRFVDIQGTTDIRLHAACGEQCSRDARTSKVSSKELYHQPPSGSLEILPAGEHIMDMILVTFIYIEMARTDEEEMSSTAGDVVGAIV